MPIEEYQEVEYKLVPLPVPKPTPITYGGVLVYMFMENSMRLPFTYEQQPSKKARVTATVAHDVISP